MAQRIQGNSPTQSWRVGQRHNITIRKFHMCGVIVPLYRHKEREPPSWRERTGVVNRQGPH